MKSRTSYSKLTAFRKDITRFAPLWALYFIGGVLAMLSIVSDSGAGYAAMSLNDTIGPFSVINLIYAAMVAQLLFGDLFNSRLCNAVHAMPLRREHWFLSHVAAGLCFSLVPNFLGVIWTVFRLGNCWFAAFVWLLGMTLEYLFFFGLAVFSCMCTGNRFAMAAVYAIINFIAPLANWFLKAVYEPMLYSVTIDGDAFSRFCPVVQMASDSDYMIFNRVELPQNAVTSDRYTYEYGGLGGGWLYLVIAALIGAALLGAALLMYRRRALESAGDFMAVAPLKPVFSLIYTLCAGALFALFGELVAESYVVFLFIGLAVGYFTGQMLLQRAVKIFKPKAFAKFAAIAVVMAASLLLTKADVFGITRWSPSPDSVKSIIIGNNYYGRDALTYTDKAQIEELIDIQQELIQLGEAQNGQDSVYLKFRFQMKDGREVVRTYCAPWQESYCTPLREILSDPESVLGYSDVDPLLADLNIIYLEGYKIEDPELQRELMEAVFADFAEGNMAQLGSLYPEETYYAYSMELECTNSGSYYRYNSLVAYSEAVHTVQWIEDHLESLGIEAYN